MAHQVQKSLVIPAPIEAAWTAISRMGAVADWHPNVAAAKVLTDHDVGIGASRRVEFHGGGGAVETVTEQSEHEYVQMSMTEVPLMQDAVVTIRVAQASATETEVTFSVVYGVQYGPFGWVVNTLMMKRMLGKAFDTALAGLSNHLAGGLSATAA
ncbi:MAG: SRPBCC family protein [Nannocystales bacterium]